MIRAIRFWPYVVRNARRNPVRSALTVLGMAVTVLVFCSLASIESSMKVAIDEVAQATLLVVGEKDQW